MKYWVYINDKVAGPYEEDKLATLEGFTPDTLLCKDGTQNWVKASSIFDFGTPEPANQPSAQTVAPAANTTFAPAATTLTQSTAAATAADASLLQMLLSKMDQLTQEIAGIRTSMQGVENKISGMETKIEGMESKVEETLQASAATKAAMEKIQTAPASSAAPSVTPAAPVAPVIHTSAAEQTPVLEEAAITNTQNLVDHAEQIVAQAATTTEEKPLDFLNEIHIGDTPADAADKGGEEVVLRSALDSMYNTPVQKEDEKENTFQDLLSPTAAAGIAAAGAAAVTAAAMSNEPVSEKAPAAEAATPTIEETPAADEKREEIINEITAPAPQEGNAVLQAIDEAQTAPVSDVPSLEDAALPEETEKKSLDLGQEEPALNLAPIPDETAADEPAAAEQQQTQPEALQEPQPQPQPTQEVLQTAQELVPGATEEAKEEILEEGLVSQQDLEEAFTERTPVSSDFPLPEDNPSQAAEQADGSFSPNDMTEVQLKEGSTYLISDFIPPSNTGNTITIADAALAATAAAVNKTTDVAEGNTAEATGEKQDPAEATRTLDQSIEEIIPNQAPDDMTMSKVILENTIRTKRGASMDIRTVPMVKEPTDSNRLDLTDSDLDLNAQHDMKEADFKQPGSNATKVILGGLVSVVFVALIYVMLAYLEIIPAQFNLLKKPAATDNVSTEQMNEMLGEPTETVAVPTEEVAAEAPLSAENMQVAMPDMQQPAEPAVNDPMDGILTEVKNFSLANGQTLEQLINARHPAAQGLIEWSVTTAVEPDNYSVLVKVPPENPQSFRITYRFNYNTVTKALDPTISDSKNLLDSVK